MTIFYQNETKNHLDTIKLQEIYGLELQKKQLSSIFRELFTDLFIFRDQNELHIYLDDNNPEHLEEMKNEYKALSSHSRLYDQIRYLDNNGQELVRVDYKNSTPIDIPTEELQNKAGRYYFSECIKLKKNQIYISPLDLNIEHKKVEVPHKPMIRLCTPVFDEHHNKKGVMLLNYLGQRLINTILSSEKTSIGYTMLLNQEGYWLKHLDSYKEWGFMFDDKKGISFNTEYPKVWEIITQQQEGQISVEQGTFTFSSVFPLQQNVLNLHNDTIAQSDYSWLLVSFLPKTELKKQTHAMLVQMFIFGASIFILAAVGSWFLAHTITKRRNFQNRLKAMAYFDTLTELPNRRQFFNRLDESISLANRYKTPFAVLYIDLDGFKYVNDYYGHDAGDSILIHVSECLKKISRKSDTVARLGGDEFAVIIPNISSKEAVSTIAAKIIAVLAIPVVLDTGQAKIGASVGISLFPEDSDDKEEILKKADSAMYLAKSQGKNNYLFYQDTIPNN